MHDQHKRPNKQIAESGELESLRKLVEEQRQLIERANGDLVKMQHDFGDFAYVVSHVLRGPISSILGIFELLDSKSLTPENEHYFEIIKSRTQIVDEVIHDLNQIVGLQRGVRDIIQVIEPKEIIENLLGYFSKEIDTKALNIQWDLDGVSSFLSSKETIRNIFYHLIDNALIHGCLSDKPQITFAASIENDLIKFVVTDNGPGMDLGKISNKIFEPYYKYSKNSHNKGLGLYLAKLQVEMLGGSIGAFSEPGKGFSVHFDIPKIERAERRVLLDSDVVRFTYYPELSAIKAKWKRDLKPSEFNEVFGFILDFIKRYKTNFWIADISDSNNNEIELNQVRRKFRARFHETGIDMLIIVTGDATDRGVNNETNISEQIQSAYTIPVVVCKSLDDAIAIISKSKTANQ
ncbi:hypothetical protein GC194_08720 [bacterium]|nr:hypothetical protein [bacterium]